MKTHSEQALKNPQYVKEALSQVPVANRLICAGMKAASDEYRHRFDQIKWRKGKDPKVKYARVKRPRQFIDPGLNVVDPMTGEVIKKL